MSTLGNALPSNRTALENALLHIEDTARELINVGREADAEVSIALALPFMRLHNALKELDELRNTIREQRLG